MVFNMFVVVWIGGGEVCRWRDTTARVHVCTRCQMTASVIITRDPFFLLPVFSFFSVKHHYKCLCSPRSASKASMAQTKPNSPISYKEIIQVSHTTPRFLGNRYEDMLGFASFLVRIPV